MSLWRAPVEEKVRPTVSRCAGERGRERYQRVGRGYPAEADTEEFPAVDSLLSGEQFFRDEGVSGLIFRGRWKRRVGA
jgi:hypothetical protein